MQFKFTINKSEKLFGFSSLITPLHKSIHIILFHRDFLLSATRIDALEELVQAAKDGDLSKLKRMGVTTYATNDFCIDLSDDENPT